MSAVLDNSSSGEILQIDSEVDDGRQFFAPVASDLVDGLLGEYQTRRRQVDQLAAVVAGDLGNAVHYFIEGNAGDDRMHRSIYLDKLFEVEGAVAALNAAYWSKLLNLTDVLDCMPAKRREAWFEQIRNPRGKQVHGQDKYAKVKKWEVEPLPEFNEATVRPTIEGLLAMRQQFFSERVDGIFRALSSEHVTNVPEGFGRRMILAHVLSEYGTTDHTRCGYINDLRVVIAKFMGRDEPAWNATSALVMAARRTTGEWVNVDGGALRLRIYKKGTAHIEVHPDMAYRLNQVLAHLHPLAIPAQFRTKPKRKHKEFQMMGRPLPFAVIELLAGMREARERVPTSPDWRADYRPVPNARTFDRHLDDSNAKMQAEAVLRAIGGVPAAKGAYFQFDYDPSEVLDQIVTSGCIPDVRAHQFYPTPEKLARLAVELAEIQPADVVLEPSAGQGGIADYLPKDRTTCIEISPLHCAVLRAKGLLAFEADFLAQVDGNRHTAAFDVVVMNPPFSEGRAKAHTEAAATCLKPGGRLVAILPASMRGKDLLAGFAHEWSSVYDNEFAGTSVSVVMLKATRSAA